jgi:hypothetical protein
MNFYVYEDGELLGEEDLDVTNQGEVETAMKKYFEFDDYDDLGIEECGEEIMILLDDCQYMCNIQYVC